MGALCGKKIKKQYKIPIAENLDPSSNNPKPIANSKPNNQINSQENQASSFNKEKSPKKQKPIEKALNNPNPNVNHGKLELNMSPQMSPQKSATKSIAEKNKSPSNFPKEMEKLTPQTNDIIRQTPHDIEDEKPKKSQIKIKNSNEPILHLEPESYLIKEFGEVVAEALFGEEDFVLPERVAVDLDLVQLIQPPLNDVIIPLIAAKTLMMEAQDIMDDYYEIDLFDVLQTFLEEDEESLKKSDIHELNSSGIQYKEDQYGKAIGRPLKSDINESHSGNFKEEIILPPKISEEEEFFGSYEEEKPRDNPESLPTKPGFKIYEPKVVEVKDQSNDFEINDFNFDKSEMREDIKFEEFNDFDKKQNDLDRTPEEDEQPYEEDIEQKSVYIPDQTNEEKKQVKNIMNYLDDENEGSQSNESEKVTNNFDGKDIFVNVEKMDDDFFLNKVDLNNFDEESKGGEKSEPNQSYHSLNEKLEEYQGNNNYQEDDSFDYNETPLNQKSSNNLLINSNASAFDKPNDKMSIYKSSSASMKKKIMWWSSQKK